MKREIIFLCVLLLPALVAGISGTEQGQNPLLASWEQYHRLKQDHFYDLHWIAIGPVMNSARVEAIQCDPARPGTMYVAFGSGNLWKTENHGLTWTAIFENQSALGIGDIALAPSNTDIIYLGSGESLKKARNFTMPGTGVFRSGDGGQTWRNTGLHDSYHIGEIAVHPHNPDIVFVAVLGHFWSTNANRGLYRSLDGGGSWQQVLTIDEKVGANDVVISPSDPRVVYASMWENYPGIAGPRSGIYRSSNGGETWQRLNRGLPAGNGTGRIGLAVSCQNPDKVYALIDNLNRDKRLAAEVYKTVDGGENWQRSHQQDLLIFPGIGWYFCDCYVNPENDEEMYALGVRLARSSDGGRTFHLVEGDIFHLSPSPAQTLHLDHCELWINPQNPAHLVSGNDGGLYVSYDRGRTWLHHNNIPAGEFYDISVDNQDPYRIYGGTQDNSSVYGPAREWDPRFPDPWKYIWIDAWSGGDGCVNIPDPSDPGTVYFSSQHGGIMRKDMSRDRSTFIRPRPPQDFKGQIRYLFVTPYIISPHNPWTLYHAGNYIFRSLNRGDSWQIVSPDLARSAHPGKVSEAVGAVAESPLLPGRIFAGTDKGAFWIRRDESSEWQERSLGLPDRYIRSICPSRYQKDRVYVTVCGINEDDLHNYIYVSEDLGITWQSLSANLPDEVAYVILEDPLVETILYAGMYRGVYVSTDRGANWSLLGPGLPAMAIADLTIQEREMDLIAASHGRSIFKMNISPLQQAFKPGIPSQPILFPAAPVTLPWINDTHRDPRLSTIEKTSITWFLPRAGDVTVRIADDGEKTVWQRDIRAHEGFNQLRWDLVVDTVDSLHPYFIHYRRFIRAGEYRLQITGVDVKLETAFSVRQRTNPPEV